MCAAASKRDLSQVGEQNANERLRRVADNLGVPKIRRHIFLCSDQTEAKCCDKAAGLESWSYLKKRLDDLELVGAGGVFFATENLEVVIDDGEVCVVAFTTPGGAAVEQDGSVLRGERYFDGSKVIRAFAVKFDGQLDVGAVGLGA